jgi:pimeloyl-ACP methyl ester carboxylesterase
MRPSSVTTESPAPVSLAVLRWGIPDARPSVLLLHGLTSAAGTWWRIASGLADAGYSVTAPDLRGHGASPRTEGYRLAAYAADVAALRPGGPGAGGPEAGGPWDLVIGHSLGAAVAVKAAESHPGWSRALLLLDPVLTVTESEHDALLAELLADLRQLDADALRRANPRWDSEDAVQKVNAVRLVSPRVVERTVLDNPDWQLEDAVERVSAGIRVRALAADPVRGASFTADAGERLSAGQPLFDYAVVPDAGHSVHRDDPARVLAEALALLP